MLSNVGRISKICNHQYFTQAAPSISLIQNNLRQFRGGSVDIHKNEETGIAELVLNYPERKNALSGSMMAELHDAVEDLKGWKTGKGLIMYGAKNDGDCFCSGGHLDTVRKLNSHEDGFHVSLVMNKSARTLRNLPLLTVSLLEGPAIGGGAELSTWTDFRLGTKNASAAFVQVKMGVCTGFGGGSSLVQCVGYPRAIDLLLTGRKLSMQEGLRLGFFDDTVDENQPLEGAHEWLQKRLQFCKPHMIKNIKAIMRQRIEVPDELKDILPNELESRLFAELWSGDAHAAAINKKIKHK